MALLPGRSGCPRAWLPWPLDPCPFLERPLSPEPGRVAVPIPRPQFMSPSQFLPPPRTPELPGFLPASALEWPRTPVLSPPRAAQDLLDACSFPWFSSCKDGERQQSPELQGTGSGMGSSGSPSPASCAWDRTSALSASDPSAVPWGVAGPLLGCPGLRSQQEGWDAWALRAVGSLRTCYAHSGALGGPRGCGEEPWWGRPFVVGSGVKPPLGPFISPPRWLLVTPGLSSQICH